MNLQSIFGGVMIGKETSNNFRISFKGLAVRADNNYFVLSDGQLLDVTGLTIDGTEGLIYRIPTKSVSPGDVIVTSDNPFLPLFIVEVQDKSIRALDPRTSIEVEYVPPLNLFNVQLFVKVVALVDPNSMGSSENGLLPLLLLAGSTAGGSTNLLPLLLMGNIDRFKGGPLTPTDLLPLLLLKDSNSDALTQLLIMQTLGPKSLIGTFAGSESGHPGEPRKHKTVETSKC